MSGYKQKELVPNKLSLPSPAQQARKELEFLMDVVPSRFECSAVRVLLSW